MRKLSFRLYTVAPSCVHHIKQLNAIGRRIPQLQVHFEDACKMQKASGVDNLQIYHESPILKRARLRTARQLATVRGGGCACWIRSRCAVDAYFQGEWNLLDFVNYLLLLAAVASSAS